MTEGMGVHGPANEIRFSERSLAIRVKFDPRPAVPHCPPTTLGDLITMTTVRGVPSTMHTVRAMVPR
jgi:hypothetical protein